MPKIQDIPDSSRSSRGGMSHQAIEDYLKTIYRLAQDGSPVSTNRLAEARSVKPASVTGMLKRLAGLELVNYQKHYGVTLTDEGRKIALEVLRHHRLIETYLIKALGFEWDEVHEQAELLEHVISEKLEERIAAYLNHPEFDPHGSPIPRADGSVPQVQTRPLTTMVIGDQGEISRIATDSNSDLLRELAKLDLVPGKHLHVLAISADRDQFTLQLAQNDHPIELGFELADAILIKI